MGEYQGVVPVLGAVVLFAALAGNAAAAPQVRHPLLSYKASDLIEREVKTFEGGHFGTIKELLVDTQGRVSHAVVQPNQEWALPGGATVAVPWESLQFIGSETRMAVYFDADELGQLSQTSVPESEPARRAFADLDLDGDGFITPAEAQGWGRLNEWFRLIDADGDGNVDPAEFSDFESLLATLKQA